MTLTWRLRYLTLDNGLSRWYIMRPWRDWHERRATIGLALRGRDGTAAQCDEGAVCCLFEGAGDVGGLADRLRGIVAVYQQCKRMDLPFRLYFKHPFDLGLFLEPADYDWRIQPGQICRDARRVKTLVMRPLSDSQYTLRRQHEWMRHTFDSLARHRPHQTHIYTNASTAYGDGYAALFSELFRPTRRLQEALDGIQAQIGGRYISVSMRFLQLLGDFDDVVYVGVTLTEAERQTLIGTCLDRLRRLHETYPGHRILVNSDSHRMLRAAACLPYAYSIPGDIMHFDRSQGHEDDYGRFEKTFLDFFTIAQADRVFLIKAHSHMRESGFPYAAALIGGKEYAIIT